MTANGIIRTFGIIIFLAVTSMKCSEVHDGMTDDEIFHAFGTTRDKIPEYDVVHISHDLHKQSNKKIRLRFTAFGEKIDTYLHPFNGKLMGKNTPVWIAYTKSNGIIKYKKMRRGIVGMVVSRFFTGASGSSAVAVNHTEGRNPSFNGKVGNMVIRPLPKRFQENATANRHGEIFNANRIMLDTDRHVIMKSTSVPHEEKMRQLGRQIREALQAGNQTGAYKVKRSQNEIIYPTILVQTDFKQSKMIRDDLDYYEEILYQLAFWNAVDLRFRHVNDPKIRLRISGLIIAQDRKATPFLHNLRVNNVVYLQNMLEEAVQYWYSMKKLEAFPATGYDISVTITDTDLSYKGVMIGGRARLVSCMGPWNSVVIVKDVGGFAGLTPATHELAHILELGHDPQSGDECDVSNGFIMSTVNVPSPNNIKWSPCSLKTLSALLRKNYMKCYDEPKEFRPIGPPIQRLLPGDVWGTHKQCQGRGYNWACDTTPDICEHLSCYFTHWPGFLTFWMCQKSGPAAEGTLCAPGHKCIDGVCQCMTEQCIFKNAKARP